MSENPPFTNVLGMRQYRRTRGVLGRRRKGNQYQYSTKEDREALLAWRLDAGVGSCCLAAYYVEAVTTSDTVPDILRVRGIRIPIACEKKCPSYVAMYMVPPEMMP